MFRGGGKSYTVINPDFLCITLIHSIISFQAGNGKFNVAIIVTFVNSDPFHSPSSLSFAFLLLNGNKYFHQFLITITFSEGHGVCFPVVQTGILIFGPDQFFFPITFPGCVYNLF